MRQRNRFKVVVIGASTLLGALLAQTAGLCWAPSISITSPDSGANIRGPDQTVSVSMQINAGKPNSRLDYYAVYYRDVLRFSEVFPTPKPTFADRSDDFCTFTDDNGSGTLKGKVWDTYAAMGMDTQSNTVDNGYIISVTRGTPASPGTVIWKYWSGGGWTSLDDWCTTSHFDTACSGWDCSTQGNTDCTGQCTGVYCCHGAPHTYCHYGDTPGFTGSGRDYPDIIDRHDHVNCDSDDYGYADVDLPATTAACGCSRSGIWLHGEGDPYCTDNQALHSTHGCVRMRNAHVQRLCDMAGTAQGRVGYDDISVSVPAGTWP